MQTQAAHGTQSGASPWMRFGARAAGTVVAGALAVAALLLVSATTGIFLPGVGGVLVLASAFLLGRPLSV